MQLVIGYILALTIGLSLGLIGGGGSILAVPVLIYVVGVSPKSAIAMSLIIVGVVSLIGAIPHWMQGNVNLKIAAIFAPAAMVGAYIGARLAGLPFITDTIQLVCFGVVMVIASVLMIRKGSRPAEPLAEAIEEPVLSDLTSKASQELSAELTPAPAEGSTAPEPQQPAAPTTHAGHGHWLAIPLEGLAVGVITGFVGVGGGFAIIPALVLLGGIPMKEAIGTSLLILTAKSITGFLGYIDQVELNWELMIGFTLFASMGTIFGAYLTRLIEAKQLQKGFGYFVLAIAIYVLIRR